jgi:GNAT superfamily N-acetyltransferase
MIARLHIAAWRETYPGLLPQDAIDRACSVTARQVQWTKAITRARTCGEGRIAVLDDLGFAMIGPQRDAGLAAMGYPEELWSIYLLRAGQGRGMGLTLLRHALGANPQPFTACVVAGNATACSFYESRGGQLLTTRADKLGDTPILEHVYGWPAPDDLLAPRPI